MDMRFHTPLTAKEQLAHGMTSPQTLALADKVRYAELDPLNHVNNKAYVGWFETLRVEHFYLFCRPLYADLPQPRAVLRSADIRFVKEMHIGDTYIATANVTAFRNTSYTVEQQIWSNGLCATLSGVMVMLHPNGEGRYPLPPALTDFLFPLKVLRRNLKLDHGAVEGTPPTRRLNHLCPLRSGHHRQSD